jgi:hypothetical protein
MGLFAGVGALTQATLVTSLAMAAVPIGFAIIGQIRRNPVKERPAEG